MVARMGSLATIGCKPGQARKGAAVATDSCAGVQLVRDTSRFIKQIVSFNRCPTRCSRENGVLTGLPNWWVRSMSCRLSPTRWTTTGCTTPICSPARGASARRRWPVSSPSRSTARRASPPNPVENAASAARSTRGVLSTSSRSMRLPGPRSTRRANCWKTFPMHPSGGATKST